MKQAVWTPITAAGEVDDAELHRPADTAEPTTWEVAIPPFGERQAQVLTAVWGLALGCPQHRFWALASQLKTLPEEGWPANVTLAVGPLRTQAEADEAIPALLAVKASRREVVFAPIEIIDLFRVNSTGRDTDRNHIRYTDALAGFTYDGLYHTDDPSAYTRHAKLDAVRVVGGEAEHIALLRTQCKNAGVEFVEESA